MQGCYETTRPPPRLCVRRRSICCATRNGSRLITGRRSSCKENGNENTHECFVSGRTHRVGLISRHGPEGGRRHAQTLGHRLYYSGSKQDHGEPAPSGRTLSCSDAKWGGRARGATPGRRGEPWG